DVGEPQLVVLERIAGDDVGLLGDDRGLLPLVALAILVASDADIADRAVIPDVLLERLDLQDSGAPTGTWAGQEPTVDFVQPDVEGIATGLLGHADEIKSIQMNNRLSKNGLESSQVLIRLGQLAAGIAEDILHLQ